jgi:hypothetical protein
MDQQAMRIREVVAPRAASLGIRSAPAVAINGKLADCCANRGPDETTLRAAGLERPVS